MRVYVEPAIKCIVDGQGRLAAILARPTFIADVSLNPGAPRKVRHPVQATALAHVHQVVVELAIPVDLAAVAPCRADELGLGFGIAEGFLAAEA